MALECTSDVLHAWFRWPWLCFYFFRCPLFCCFDLRNFDVFCIAMNDRIAIQGIVQRNSLCKKSCTEEIIFYYFGGNFFFANLYGYRCSLLRKPWRCTSQKQKRNEAHGCSDANTHMRFCSVKLYFAGEDEHKKN